MQRIIITLAMLALFCLPSAAQEYKLADIAITHPHARAVPPTAPVSGGYMVISNSGTRPDRLIRVSADFAGKVELHEMKMEGDVMKMRAIKSGLEIPAGGRVELKPGGYHVMFMQLREELKAGDKHKAKLMFENAGEIEIEFSVEEIRSQGEMNHSEHGN